MNHRLFDVSNLVTVLIIYRKDDFFKFNDALNTLYLRLYCVGHFVKDHWIAHTMAFVIPVVEHWLKREIAQWVHHEGLIRQSITPCFTKYFFVHFTTDNQQYNVLWYASHGTLTVMECVE